MASPLERVAPESVGISPASVIRFIDGLEAEGLEPRSLMLLRHGKVAAEGWWAPYGAELPFYLYSLSKSFLSTAVGFAVEEGYFTLDDPVLSFFPNEAPTEPSDNLKAMRVWHLLTMNTGQEAEPGRDKEWVRSFLEWPVPRVPGTNFLYNSLATFMASAIVQKTTGMTALDYLKPRLLDPLGIESATWDENPDGITIGGWGMSLCTEDIAKFGQLYLQRGAWEDKRILSEKWVERATSKQVDSQMDGSPDWKQGYGYQFWRCVPEGFYRGDGAFGQFCIVMPRHDMVLAMTSASKSLQGILDNVWKHLGPSNEAGSGEELQERLRSLSVPGPIATASGAVPTATFRAEGSAEFASSCRFESAHDGFRFIREAGDVTTTFNVGFSEWTRTDGVPWWRGPCTVVSKAAWTAPETLQIRMLNLREPSNWLHTVVFGDNRVKITTERSAMFVQAEGPAFDGVTSLE